MAHLAVAVQGEVERDAGLVGLEVVAQRDSLDLGERLGSVEDVRARAAAGAALCKRPDHVSHSQPKGTYLFPLYLHYLHFDTVSKTTLFRNLEL